MISISGFIYQYKPCTQATHYLRDIERADGDLETAWNQCERIDWLAWFLRKMAFDDIHLLQTTLMDIVTEFMAHKFDAFQFAAYLDIRHALEKGQKNETFDTHLEKLIKRTDRENSSWEENVLVDFMLSFDYIFNGDRDAAVRSAVNTFFPFFEHPGTSRIMVIFKSRIDFKQIRIP